MLSIPLGPLALPTGPVMLLLAVWLATVVAHRLTKAAPTPLTPPAGSAPDDRPLGSDLGWWIQQAVLVGLLAARLAHLALHASDYRLHPWAALDLRDGGWQPLAGALVGLAWLAGRVWRQAPPAPMRRALAISVAAGLGLWGAGQGLLAHLAPRALPDLTLTDLRTGQAVALRASVRGDPVVLNLWASWCGPCRAEMPLLAAAQARHPTVRFVFVNQGEGPAAVQRYLQGERLALDQVLLDPEAALGPALGSRGLPTTVAFNARGERVAAHLGVLNAAALAALVATAEGGEGR